MSENKIADDGIPVQAVVVNDKIKQEKPPFIKSGKSVVYKFIEEGVNINTKTKTNQDVRLFEHFLNCSVAEDQPILQSPSNELCEHLSNIIFAVRKRDDSGYEPISLFSYFQSIQRCLNDHEYGHSLRDRILNRYRC